MSCILCAHGLFSSIHVLSSVNSANPADQSEVFSDLSTFLGPLSEKHGSRFSVQIWPKPHGLHCNAAKKCLGSITGRILRRGELTQPHLCTRLQHQVTWNLLKQWQNCSWPHCGYECSCCVSVLHGVWSWLCGLQALTGVSSVYNSTKFSPLVGI